MRMGESQGTKDRAFQRKRQLLVCFEDFKREHSDSQSVYNVDMVLRSVSLNGSELNSKNTGSYG